MKKIILLLASFTLLNAANSNNLTDLKPQKDYLKVNISHPLTLTEKEQKSGKIELLEFFWYGCPHCYHMDPMIDKLMSEHKNQVVLKRYPVVFPRWESGARLFFTIQEMGLENKLHTKIFDAVQTKHNNVMDDKKARNAFLNKEGVDIKKFDSLYNSFTIDSKMKTAAEVVKNYNIQSSPMFVVNNIYEVEPALTDGYPRTIANLNIILNSLENHKVTK